MCGNKNRTQQAGGHCGCSHHGGAGSDPAVRLMPHEVDLIFPDVPTPDQRIASDAGEDLLRKLVRRHHERLAASSVGALIDQTPEVFDATVQRIADFVIERCGGKSDYTSEQGHVCMRVRHFPFTIDERSRDVWLRELLQALVEVEFLGSLLKAYWEWVEPMSIRMINRRTRKAQPARYPFAQVQPFLVSAGKLMNPIYG
jgi:hemoglobin